MCTDATGAPADSSACPGFRPAAQRACNLQPCGNCTAAETCKGHGTCAQDGFCACSDGYSGVFCQVTARLPSRKQLTVQSLVPSSGGLVSIKAVHVQPGSLHTLCASTCP